MGWNPVGNITKFVQNPSAGTAVQSLDWLNLTGKDGLAQSLGGKKPNLDPTNVKKTEVKPAQTTTTQEFLAKAQNPVTQVVAPTLGAAPFVQGQTIDQSQLAGARAQQAALASQLANPAGSGIAGAQLQAGNEAALAAARAQAASNRGGSAALANRNVGNQLSQATLQNAQAGALAALQERQANQQLLAQLSGTQFAQEAGLASNQAQLGQSAALANQGVQSQYGLNQAQLAQQAAIANQSAQLSQLGIQGNAAMSIDQAVNQGNLTQAQLDAQRQQQISAARGALYGTAGQAAVTAAIASDERVKKDKAKSSDKANEAAKEFLDALQSFEFRYNGDSPKSEPYLGVMAQDLEKTRLGRQMVRPGPDGVKRVDFGQGFGALAAAIGELNKKLEGRNA